MVKNQPLLWRDSSQTPELLPDLLQVKAAAN